MFTNILDIDIQTCIKTAGMGNAIFSFSSRDNTSSYNPLNKKAVAELIRLNAANLVQRDGVKSMKEKKRLRH